MSASENAIVVPGSSKACLWEPGYVRRCRAAYAATGKGLFLPARHEGAVDRFRSTGSGVTDQDQVS
ncbi:hypothetical protein THS27_00255 [Thalassospira sp. MCCC 1A01428]|nr:hypothetical protein THS27_00255 [Thalassospira sp. MCCC 1A01428]